MLRNWYENEKEKLSTMDRAKAVQYIWQYYKLWIIGIVAAVCVLAAGAFVFLKKKRA